MYSFVYCAVAVGSTPNMNTTENELYFYCLLSAYCWSVTAVTAQCLLLLSAYCWSVTAARFNTPAGPVSECRVGGRETTGANTNTKKIQL